MIRLRSFAVWVALLSCLPPVLAHAAPLVAVPPEARSLIRQLAVQHNGRNKPLDSFARETLQLITGSPRYAHADPVETVLSIMANPDAWHEVPLVAVPFVPLRQALGIGQKTTHVSYNELVATRTLMRMLPAIVQKQQRDEKLSMLEQETMDLYERFVALSGLFEQDVRLVPPPSATEHAWLPILKPAGYSPEQQAAFTTAWSNLMTALRTSPSLSATAARQLAALVSEANPTAYPAAWRLHLEVVYNRIGLFRTARLAYVVAFLGLLLAIARSSAPAGWLGRWALWIAFSVHAVGIVIRVILGGRPPVSNFYETMLWLPLVAVGLSLFFDRLHRAAFFGLAASLLAAVVLLLADHLPLDSSVSPVVAVLRSNLWLTVHVLTIVASYGALALAAVLAHIYGILYLGQRRAQAELASIGIFLYRTIQVGVVLLAAGIMLGAVWANASWGRYWGWDPKETWALITLLWYLAVLHGRFAGWIRGAGVAISTIAGFFLLLMTYYGVSFYLAGLHSYAGGHSKPLPPLLIGYAIAELAFLSVLGSSAAGRRHSVGR